MNRKLIIVLVGLVALGLGLAAALYIGRHDHAAASEHSSSVVPMFGALTALGAAMIAASAAQRKKKRDE